MSAHDWPPHRLDDPAALAAWKAESADYRRGYEQGEKDEQEWAAEKDERSIPPLLRRFYWYDNDRFAEDWKIPWISGPGTNGHDEWCNPVVGIRLLGGVLYVRVGRKLRLPLDGPCAACLEEMKDDRPDHPDDA